MDRDLFEIREAMDWARKELARVRDHVEYQLDLRAPLAFFQVTQDPAADPPVAHQGEPFFVQEEAGYERPAGTGPTGGRLHCIREGDHEPPGVDVHVESTLGTEGRAAAQPGLPPGGGTTALVGPILISSLF